MKKIYIKPEASIHEIKTESLLTTLSMGGSTDTQLSKGNNFWDDEEDEF